MNINSWKKHAINMLYNSDSPKLDVEILLSYVINKERSWVLAFDDSELNKFQLKILKAMLKRRFKGEPIAYIVGECEFWSILLQVNNSTLIPRSDTEILVEQALKYLPSIPSLLLDLGTGTGAIALALASERSDCQIIGCDRIPEAVKLAQTNAKRLNINNVYFQFSHWFTEIAPQKFELIVSNPPYIDAKNECLKSNNIRFEPISALVAEDNGIRDLRTLIYSTPHWLKPKGWLLLEHSWQQGKLVREMMKNKGYSSIKTINDYGGNPRVTLGQYI